MEKLLLRLEVGHESVMLDTPIPAEPYPHTHRWTVFVRSVSGVRLDSNLVEKVIFQLHEDFKCSRRVVASAPFEVTETGYAGFAIPIIIRFAHCKREYHVEYDMNLRYVPQDKVKVIQSFEFINPNPSLRKRLCHAKAELILPQRTKVSQQPSTSAPSSAFLDLFGEPLHVGAAEKAKVARNGAHGGSKPLHDGKAKQAVDADGWSAKEAAAVERKLAKKRLPLPSNTVQNGFASKSTRTVMDTNGVDDGSGCSLSDTILCVETPTKLKLRIGHLNVDELGKHGKKGKKKKRRRSDSGLDSEGSSAQPTVAEEPSPSDQLPSSSGRELTQPTPGQLLMVAPSSSSNTSQCNSLHKASSSSSAQCSRWSSSGLKATGSPDKCGTNSRCDQVADHRVSAKSLARLRDKIASVNDPSLAQRIADLIAKHADFDVVAGHFLQFDLCTMNSQVIRMLESCFQKRS
uniref:AHD domain-containing protein n=1 Tax=Trichuris muris TaxID=70415 RepID=A0A5S6Q8R0_TRIMR